MIPLPFFPLQESGRTRFAAAYHGCADRHSRTSRRTARSLLSRRWVQMARRR